MRWPRAGEKRPRVFDYGQIVTYIESGRSHGPAFPASFLNDNTIPLRGCLLAERAVRFLASSESQAHEMLAENKTSMRKTTQPVRWLLCALWFVCLLAPAARAAAQVRILPATSELPSAQIDLVLRRAQQLEGERRWGEALAVYEEALRDYPHEQKTFGDRQSLAKIHYDLGRRYGDSSFLRALVTLQERQAMALYSEVLVKIE